MRLGSGAFAACCVVIEVLGVALFLRGFFPAPVRSSSRAEQRAEPAAPEPSAGASSNWTKLPPPLFKKVVIMLIDGLRDDFVFGSKGVKFMPYTTYLVEKGASHSFVAEAKLPTVTMPRIKALMTGSLPGFIDVVRNLNSPELLEDNVITQAKAAGKRIIFYGDETWVKLFPKHFVEYDGTTSFFVSDYTEVDDNVTRHLDKVLKRGDWDMLILHYLGLDHIGHVSGPSSPLIGHKLREMDSILMKIHTSLLSERETLVPNLLVLCGDHGMSETGGHGASSMEELNTARNPSNRAWPADSREQCRQPPVPHRGGETGERTAEVFTFKCSAAQQIVARECAVIRKSWHKVRRQAFSEWFSPSAHCRCFPLPGSLPAPTQHPGSTEQQGRTGGSSVVACVFSAVLLDVAGSFRSSRHCVHLGREFLLLLWPLVADSRRSDGVGLRTALCSGVCSCQDLW
uniref:Phosphatidylinositol glycan anchor biosynthesis class G n=2 Tax=Canis lupus familiaris TaxID=9615 RepID=A0A8P0SY65_CANLF